MCIAGYRRHVQFDHALTGLDCREVEATVHVRQGVDTVVQCDHRATDTALATILPAVAVQVLEHLADDRAQVKHGIGTDL